MNAIDDDRDVLSSMENIQRLINRYPGLIEGRCTDEQMELLETAADVLRAAIRKAGAPQGRVDAILQFIWESGAETGDAMTAGIRAAFPTASEAELVSALATNAELTRAVIRQNLRDAPPAGRA